MHGSWYADYMIHTSDRRLKTNIRPLDDLLEGMAQKGMGEQGATRLASDQVSGGRGGAPQREDGAAWVLRELRPVSYNFIKGLEAKTAPRFGFIADDLAVTIPQVVKERETGPKYKGVLYQDLIAVLTSALQSLQRSFDEADAARRALQQRLDEADATRSAMQQSAEDAEVARQARFGRIEASLANKMSVSEAEVVAPSHFEEQHVAPQAGSQARLEERVSALESQFAQVLKALEKSVRRGGLGRGGR